MVALLAVHLLATNLPPLVVVSNRLLNRTQDQLTLLPSMHLLAMFLQKMLLLDILLLPMVLRSIVLKATLRPMALHPTTHLRATIKWAMLLNMAMETMATSTTTPCLMERLRAPIPLISRQTFTHTKLLQALILKPQLLLTPLEHLMSIHTGSRLLTLMFLSRPGLRLTLRRKATHRFLFVQLPSPPALKS